MQNIIVGILIVFAAGYVARSLVRSVLPSVAGGGCGHGCGSCKATAVETPAPGRIPLEMR